MCAGAGRYPLPLGGLCGSCNGARRIAHSMNASPHIQAMVGKLNDRFLRELEITRAEVNGKRHKQKAAPNDEWTEDPAA